jgi:RNA polymerase sigma factor (sigma-70 family)
MTDSISELVDHLFRHKTGQMVAILTHIFGIENLQLAEDVVQDTLLQALQQWSYRGVPQNPGGWLMQVAKNRALDILRRQANYRNKLGLLANREQAVELAFALEDVGGDDQLTMMFIGCHPALPAESQIALLLKTVGGFGISEIARAFLIPEATVAQRIVRAKRKIREQGLSFQLPSHEQLSARLDAVLMILYLIFNEGYNASQGDALIRHDLCTEAIRLCSILVEHPLGQTPKVHALMALMLF